MEPSTEKSQPSTTSVNNINSFSNNLPKRKCSFCKAKISLPELMPHVHACMTVWAKTWSMKLPCSQDISVSKLNNEIIEIERPKKKQRRNSNITRECIVRSANCKKYISKPNNIVIHNNNKTFVVCRLLHFKSDNCTIDIKNVVINNKVSPQSETENIENNESQEDICENESCTKVIKDWIVTTRDMSVSNILALKFCSFHCLMTYMQTITTLKWETLVATFNEQSKTTTTTITTTTQ